MFIFVVVDSLILGWPNGGVGRIGVDGVTFGPSHACCPEGVTFFMEPLSPQRVDCQP